MSMQAKPKAYVPCCVPPSPHPHADMTDPHGTGGHVGGAEPPDGAGSQQLHTRSPRGTDLCRDGLRPTRQRRTPRQGDAQAQRTPASATQEPTQRRRTSERARRETGRQAEGGMSWLCTAVQNMVKDGSSSGRRAEGSFVSITDSLAAARSAARALTAARKVVDMCSEELSERFVRASQGGRCGLRPGVESADTRQWMPDCAVLDASTHVYSERLRFRLRHCDLYHSGRRC